MSLIQCTSDCAYQKDGYCGLEQATHVTNDAAAVQAEHCLYYLAKTKGKENRRPASPG